MMADRRKLGKTTGNLYYTNQDRTAKLVSGEKGRVDVKRTTRGNTKPDLAGKEEDQRRGGHGSCDWARESDINEEGSYQMEGASQLQSGKRQVSGTQTRAD